MSLVLVAGMILMKATPKMEDVLDAVRADQINAGENVQPPLSAPEIEAATQQAKRQSAIEIPEDFLEFLSRANGIDYNGVVIYGGTQSPEQPGPGGFWQGLSAANVMWGIDGQRNWLVIGETDMDILTVDHDGSNPVIRDKVSHDINERFISVQAMIGEVLRRRL